MTDILLLIIGLVLIVGGANFLTDGASSLAAKFGVSPLIIGLTIVAFGTSAPELAVSVTSALHGNADISVGNVVGSNILNVLLIGGLTSVIRPLPIGLSTKKWELPMALVFTLMLVLMCLDQTTGLGTQNVVSRIDGVILLVCFMGFLTYTFLIGKKNTGNETNDTDHPKDRSYLICGIFIICGLAALVYGGRFFVDSASAIARKFGISEAIIGITIVALGTSLPELATSVVAAIKGQHDIAVGNIVGSNIFNITLILGASASISPLYIKGISSIDLFTMLGSIVLLYIFTLFWGSSYKITRIEGSIMLLVFIAYMSYLLF